MACSPRSDERVRQVTPPADAKRRVLVLITSQYPAEGGDSAFLANEIDEVASRFDQVFVFSYFGSPEPSVTLPPNAVYAGSLSAAPRRLLLDALASRRGLGQVWDSIRSEFSSGDLRRRPARVLGNVLTGTRFAEAIQAQLARHGVKPSDEVSIYAFWGAHGAMALPFLPHTFRKTMRLHGFDLYEDTESYLPLRPSLYGSVQNLVPISEHGRHHLLQGTWGEAIAGQVALSRLGVPDRGVTPSAHANGTPVLVVSCSSLIPLKRVGRILAAVEALSKVYPVHWVHFGGGPEEDELRKAADEAQARSPRLKAELRGRRSPEEIFSFYGSKHVDAFVNLSESEGVPVSIMEALSFGIPVVATDVGGTGELVNEATGAGVLLASDPSTDEVVAAIDAVVRDAPSFRPRETWAQMADAAITSKQIADLVSGEKAGASDHAPRLLILSFSDITKDARVLKQVREFSKDYEVVTCSYGPRPEGSSAHFRLPDDAVYWRYSRPAVAARFYERAYWTNPAVKAAKEMLRGSRFDAVLADDLDTVPLALTLAPRGAVHADLHEYAPREKEDLLRWRLFVGPFRSWMCKKYLPECASVTTVSKGLAEAYAENFGVKVEVCTNATPLQDLPVRPTGVPMRLVHSGACMRGRGLEEMARAVVEANAPVTLDYYLTPNDPLLLRALKEEFPEGSSVTIHDPVPYDELVGILNGYDIGFYALPPRTFSHKFALPNKVFDFVQARLALIVGPSPEMAELVKDYGLGTVTPGFEVQDIVGTLRTLDPEEVDRWKRNADRAAADLSSGPQVAVWRSLVDQMVREEQRR